MHYDPSKVPEIPTAASLNMIARMNASELYRLLCDSLTASDMAKIDRAMNMAAGCFSNEPTPLEKRIKEVSAEKTEYRGKTIEERRTLHAASESEDEFLAEWASDHGLSEEEALRELEARAYWA